MSKTATTTAKKSFLSNKWLTNCFCAVSGCDFILAHTTLCCFYLITLCVYLYHRLYIKTAYRDCYIQSMTCTHKLLKATGAPAALLPATAIWATAFFLFCCVPMSYRRRRTRRCCRLRCRASGRTTSGCRRSHRARWPVSSKSPSCCATSTSLVSFTAARACTHGNQQSDANRTVRVFLRSTHLLCSDIFWKHTHIPILFNLTVSCPESWTCLLVREYANRFLGGKKDIYHPVMTFADWPTQAAVLMCYARVLLVVCVCMYDSVCVDVCASIYCFKYLTSWA